MIYTIDTSQSFALNWGAKGVERILQNVFNLINTWKYEVAYNRTMGLDTKMLDMPPDKLTANYVAEVYQVISDYEPRATVKEVKYLRANDEGNMDFRVVVDI